MTGLFSHAPQEPDDETAGTAPLPARTAAVRVPVDAEHAFEGFTEYIHLWWPADRHSRLGAGSHFSLDRDGLQEENDAGEAHAWAELVRAEPPGLLELRLLHLHEQAPPSHLALRFVDAGGVDAGDAGTEVRLEHGGWAAGRAGEAQYAASGYWSDVLDAYGRFMGSGR
ncbi:hypothetical protein GCM10022377_11430 [Zhihengliuella alba]|uniref:ATPase n=1 Tax=Zhihengliuella alba TaxID=547018 RepID=A0ABP7D803_9MICC